ncbi:MAG: prolipoprotein diacylglyceryl transferase [Anaerolineales bacterium]|nr:prolipoprotein diacylglyceryl transferase [Anaerolineales bacterium]
MSQTIDLILFDLPVYTAFVFLGAAMGLSVAFWYLRQRARRAITPVIFLDGALIVCAAGWLGARAYHVALNWEYYAARPDEIAQIGAGGLAMRGAFVTGLIALVIFARVRALRLGKLADASALGLAAGQAIGWIGALARGANYGVVSDSPIALELPDVYGLFAPRFPLQHFEIGLFVSLFVGLIALAMQKPRAGTLFLVYVLIAAAANFALGFQRGDETIYVGALRVDQIMDLFLGAGAFGALIFVSLRAERNDNSKIGTDC